jgi:RNA polymerase sigma factor (sigma-70 family)
MFSVIFLAEQKSLPPSPSLLSDRVSTPHSSYIDEPTLVDLLHKQDREAIPHIYRQYRSALLGAIVRIVGEAELAEDVLQECLVKFWRHGSSYDPAKGRLFTWMLNICRNAAIDKTRSKEYKYRAEIRLDGSFVSEVDHHKAYELATDQIGLREMVEKLDPKYRELVELVYFGGRSQREAAKELDLPVGTVKTRLRSALGTLRKWVKQ